MFYDPVGIKAAASYTYMVKKMSKNTSPWRNATTPQGLTEK